MGVHLAKIIQDRKLGPEVDDVSLENFRVDLGGIERDDGEILCMLVGGDTDFDGRGEEDIAQDTVLRGAPLQHFLAVGLVLLHQLFRLVQLILKTPLNCLILLLILGRSKTSLMMRNQEGCA